MYSFLASPATRAVPLDWAQLVQNALAIVQAAPSEAALNALAMMSSCAAAAPSAFTNLSRSARDVTEYVALLIALDDAVAAWPLRLRQLLSLPPVAFVPAGAGGNSSLVTVQVRTPRGEALAFLLNVALQHVEEGLHYLARVMADTASTTSVTTPQGGSVAAPNQNARLAAQHFKQAVELLQSAETLHASPASPSAVALQHLRSLMPLDDTLAMAQLAAATAKYMYALSSASTKSKPDLLAQLAFDAAQQPLPASVAPSSSLQLLPTLLLAAYHFHKSTWYYGHASPDGPEMADALGHVRYADTLLRGCDAQWGVEAVQQEEEQRSQQWWGRRLASLLTGGGKKGTQRATTNDAHQHGTSDNAKGGEADGSEDADVPVRPSTQYPHLYALATQVTSATGDRATTNISAAPPDVVQVYPYLRLLLHDVCAARHQYERENRIVYFATVTTADEVRRDVPDTAHAAPQTPGVATKAEGDVFASRAALFSSLPTAAALQTALAAQEEVGQAQQALARALQRLERDGRRLSAYVTPPAALMYALDALEDLLPAAAADWASPETVVAVAADAIDAAGTAFTKVAADWQEDHDVYVGERCPPPAVVAATMKEVAAWTERASAALAGWTALRIPSTVAARAEFVEALVPRSADMTDFVEQVDAIGRDVRDVLAAAPGTVTLAQVQSAVEAVEKVRLAGAELIAEAATATPNKSRSASSPVGEDAEVWSVSPQYAVAEAAVLAVVAALQEAPIVVAHVEEAAAALAEMQSKAVVVPLTRLYDVHFKLAAKKKEEEVKEEKKKTRPRISGLPRNVTPAAVSSSPSASSRKRDRSASPPAPTHTTTTTEEESGSSSSSDASVSSSQLAEAEEAAPTPADGATRATVSAGLLQRMRANKARSLSATNASPNKGGGAAATARSEPPKKMSKTKGSRTKR